MSLTIFEKAREGIALTAETCQRLLDALADGSLLVVDSLEAGVEKALAVTREQGQRLRHNADNFERQLSIKLRGTDGQFRTAPEHS